MSAQIAASAAEGEEFEFDGEVRKVGPKCEGNVGNWVCTVHGETFPHNMAMQSHCSDGRHHVVAWNCWEHGPEVP